jgi:glutaredoxin 3
MADKRKVEIFGAGCQTCHEAIEAIKREAGPASEIVVHDMKDIHVVRRAKELGVHSVPAVVIDGRLAPCCSGRGVDLHVLKDAGLGKAL